MTLLHELLLIKYTLRLGVPLTPGHWGFDISDRTVFPRPTLCVTKTQSGYLG